MAQFANYDPGRVSVVWNGILITGFSSGTFVSAEREVETFTKDTGADGLVTRVRSRNKSGTVTLTLSPSSPANDLLSALHKQDEDFGTGYGELLIKDLNGTTLLSAEKSWIQKWPNVEQADEVSPREWMIDCAELEMYVGSAVIV
jgi:hypothetical protein